MNIQIANNELSNCQNLDQVISLINDYHESDDDTCDLIAAKYAHSCADESGYEVDILAIEGHLSYLEENGANFNYKEAAKYALNIDN